MAKISKTMVEVVDSVDITLKKSEFETLIIMLRMGINNIPRWRGLSKCELAEKHDGEMLLRDLEGNK